jgi:hypothetical protein
MTRRRVVVLLQRGAPHERAKTIQSADKERHAPEEKRCAQIEGLAESAALPRAPERLAG